MEYEERTLDFRQPRGRIIQRISVQGSPFRTMEPSFRSMLDLMRYQQTDYVERSAARSRPLR